MMTRAQADQQAEHIARTTVRAVEEYLGRQFMARARVEQRLRDLWRDELRVQLQGDAWPEGGTCDRRA